jgi:hypothetical protein
MPTFGFAAFLKLASLNPKTQKTALRDRLFGEGQPYDFHRSLKLASKKLIFDGVGLPELLEAAKAVKQAPERKSLMAGLGKLALWRGGVGGTACLIPPKVYQSPSGLFKIAAQPEFGLVSGSERVAFHLWNTKTTDLKPDVAYATLALLPELYATDPLRPTDFAVLSLLEPKVFRLSDRAVTPLDIARIIGPIERAMREIYDERDGPPPPGQPGPHPPGP